MQWKTASQHAAGVQSHLAIRHHDNTRIQHQQHVPLTEIKN